MSETGRLVEALKRVLKARGIGYRELGRMIELSEPSVKRLFSAQTFTLARLEEVCARLDMTVLDLAKMAHGGDDEAASTLTVEQESLLASDTKTFSFFYLLLGGMTPDAIERDYDVSRRERTRMLVALDRVGLLTLHPGDRVQMRVSRQVKWRRGGPLRAAHEQRMREDFFDSSFNGPDEMIRLVTGAMAPASQRILMRRIERLLREYDDLTETSGGAADEGGAARVAMMIAVRPWSYAVVAGLRRRRGAAKR